MLSGRSFSDINMIFIQQQSSVFTKRNGVILLEHRVAGCIALTFNRYRSLFESITNVWQGFRAPIWTPSTSGVTYYKVLCNKSVAWTHYKHSVVAHPFQNNRPLSNLVTVRLMSFNPYRKIVVTQVLSYKIKVSV